MIVLKFESGVVVFLRTEKEYCDMYINQFFYISVFIIYSFQRNFCFSNIIKTKLFVDSDLKKKNMSIRCIQTTVRNVPTLWMINSRRQFQTSVLRLSADIFHVKDDADFQKQVLDSKKSFIVDFHASW